MSKIPIIRYGIYWVSLDPARGHEIKKRRPCVVVSPDGMHRSNMAVVCPCTTSIHRKWPYRLQVHFNDCENEIMVDQIRAVSLDRFEGYICTLEPKAVTELREVIARLYTI